MSGMTLEKVGKAYNGEWVLRAVSARFAAGEAVALLGPSGVGKTTLARLLLGLEQPDEGTITGNKIRFGCVFQEDRLLEGFSAEENLRLALPRAAFEQGLSALSALGLTPEDTQKPARQLSGGQKRRVALARAVASPGEALLLDEPFKGLDADTKQLAIGYIRQNRRGRNLLLITHEEAEAEALCTRKILLQSCEKRVETGEETACAADI